MTVPKKNRNPVFTGLLALVGILASTILALAAWLFFQICRSSGSLVTSGKKRSYLLHVPQGYRADRPSPLVISIHGYAEWPAHQMQISHWNQLADEHNFIVVYPTGQGLPLHWLIGGQAGTLQDVQFIADLIDKLEQDYAIDPARIYANGLSNGGGMSFLLAAKYSRRIAAFGGVAGAYLLPWADYQPERPVPAIIFHGTRDPIVPFEGGPSRSFKYPFPNINAWVKTLAAHNGCGEEALALPARGEVSGVRYPGGASRADVDYYIVANGGHAWPGGGYVPRFIVGHTTQDIDATRVMWKFFEEHPLE